MINQVYLDRLQARSVIRELSEYATKRGAEIGYENVFDYSLGNPSVPTPDAYNREIIRLHETMEPMALHGYSPSNGIPSVREEIAASLESRFGLPYEACHIFPTSGAAGALAHALRAVSRAGDNIVGIAPFFPEYTYYVGDTGAGFKVVPAQFPDFQINLPELERLIDADTAAVLINSPNNPSGVVYTGETLSKLSNILNKKQEEFGHEIFLISDEPYREIVYEMEEAPYPAAFYDNTLTCYSFSKSLSLPGERIGYVAVNPRAKAADVLVPVMAQISRGIGHNCPSSSVQLAVAKSLDLTADISVYRRNRDLLYDKLLSLGFTVKLPDGTFYIFPKAAEEDAKAFCKKALAYDLILVPADNFGAEGYFRMAYCIDTEKVERSLDAIERFVKNEYGR